MPSRTACSIDFFSTAIARKTRCGRTPAALMPVNRFGNGIETVDAHSISGGHATVPARTSFDVARCSARGRSAAFRRPCSVQWLSLYSKKDGSCVTIQLVGRSPNQPKNTRALHWKFHAFFWRECCRKRTPGPPPFPSMNSMPAASMARLIISSRVALRGLLNPAST